MTVLTTKEIRARYAALYALARREAGAADAEDIVQDTWLAALRAPAIDTWGGWLSGVLWRQARRSHRGRIRREQRERSFSPPQDMDFDEQLEARRDVAAVLEALRALPDSARRAVVGRHVEQASYDALAKREGVSVNTMRWRVKDGVDRLRRAVPHRAQRRRSLLLIVVLGGASAAGVVSTDVYTSSFHFSPNPHHPMKLTKIIPVLCLSSGCGGRPEPALEEPGPSVVEGNVAPATTPTHASRTTSQIEPQIEPGDCFYSVAALAVDECLADSSCPDTCQQEYCTGDALELPASVVEALTWAPRSCDADGWSACIHDCAYAEADEPCLTPLERLCELEKVAQQTASAQ